MNKNNFSFSAKQNQQLECYWCTKGWAFLSFFSFQVWCMSEYTIHGMHHTPVAFLFFTYSHAFRA